MHVEQLFTNIFQSVSYAISTRICNLFVCISYSLTVRPKLDNSLSPSLYRLFNTRIVFRTLSPTDILHRRSSAHTFPIHTELDSENLYYYTRRRNKSCIANICIIFIWIFIYYLNSARKNDELINIDSSFSI